MTGLKAFENKKGNEKFFFFFLFSLLKASSGETRKGNERNRKALEFCTLNASFLPILMNFSPS
jgi:hypothetical protein